MAIKDALLPEYDHEMGTARKLLERLPEDKLSWRPHDRSMTMARLATHVAELPGWTSGVLVQSVFDVGAGGQQGPRGDVTGRAPRDLRQGGRCGTHLHRLAKRPGTHGAMDAEAGQSGVLYDAEDRRHPDNAPQPPHSSSGPVERVLRLNNVPVPAIYGRSADEAM